VEIGFPLTFANMRLLMQILASSSLKFLRKESFGNANK
jgi:hypothetical protein